MDSPKLGSKLYKGTKWADLIKELQKIEEHHLPPLAHDPVACKACKEENDKLTKEDQPDLTKPSTAVSARFKELNGTAKTGEIEEFTYSQWSSTATDIVLLNLLQEYEKTSKEAKDKKPALLDPLTVKVGLSFSGHKKVQNVFQLAYVKQAGNQML